MFVENSISRIFLSRRNAFSPHVLSEYHNFSNEIEPEAINLKWTIYTSPKPFIDPMDIEHQKLAIQSWLEIDPKPKIVFIGNHSSWIPIAQEFGIVIESRIDTNFKGMPLFHSFVERVSHDHEADFVVVINADIVLTNSFLRGLIRINRRLESWFAIGARFDVDEYPIDGFGEEAQSFAEEFGTLHTWGGMDFWAWNAPKSGTLIQGVFPPFIYGRSKVDNWFTHEVIHGGLRQVVDATELLTSIHVSHTYNYLIRKPLGYKNHWDRNKKTNYEAFINVHLSLKHGSYRNQQGTVLHAPWKLVRCERLYACLVKRIRPANCTCEFSSSYFRTLTDPKTDGDSLRCGFVAVDKAQDYDIPVAVKKQAVVGLPHTLPQLLSSLQNQSDLMIVLKARSEDRIQIMNTICALKKLKHDAVLVAALDEDLYRYLFIRGVAVFLHGKNAKGSLTEALMDSILKSGLSVFLLQTGTIPDSAFLSSVRRAKLVRINVSDPRFSTNSVLISSKKGSRIFGSFLSCKHCQTSIHFDKKLGQCIWNW